MKVYIRARKHNISADNLQEELAKAEQLVKEINIPGTRIIVERQEKKEENEN